MHIAFPIFVKMKDCGEIKEYESIYAMQDDLEKIDVENDEYEVWSSDGKRLKLGVQKPLWLTLEPVSETHAHLP